MICPDPNEPAVITDFPCAIKEIEHQWIPMGDGVRLSARIWLPDDAETDPVPAILEYIPYRKRDGTRGWDDPRHAYWAGHGYASIRLDIRGTGESEGLITDEYTLQEQDDAVEAIAWIAAQPWCTGNVGMTGISWGGFNSLQVAARRPPALKAIITHCSTDDRYADDVHFMGGCVLSDGFFWGSGFHIISSKQPDPAIVGDGWREAWKVRLENAEPALTSIWMQHQRRDAYWKHGSVCENYDDITCAVYAVGGWNDGYSNAVPRMLANLTCPRKGLVGPWGHKYPQDAIPAPSIGFLQDSLRWWDHWLKDQDTGIMDEPMYRVWMGEPAKPEASQAVVPGRWVTEPTWPSPNIATETLAINADGLADKAGDEAVLEHRSPQTVGVAAGVWCPYGLGGSSPDLPIDQREDDARSLCFDGAPLAEPIAIMGAPVVRLKLAIDRPQGFVAVRLNDVHPDGQVQRITFGVLNLSHRKSHEFPEPMTPGAFDEVTVQLNDIGHVFRPGHRIRVAISTTYWPMVWPSPEPVTLSLAAGTSALVLPVRGTDTDVTAFPAPQMAPLVETRVIEDGAGTRTVERNLATAEQLVRVVEDGGVWYLAPVDVTCADGVTWEACIQDDDPLSAQITYRWHNGRRRDGTDYDVETRSAMTIHATAKDFVFAADIDAFDGGRRIFSRRWDETIPRDNV
ncbi:MAG: CocE/NonD family hydrolase [Pseudomonadota bacterium]